MINEVLNMLGAEHAEILISTRQGTEKVLVDQDDLFYAEELNRLVIYKDPKGRKLARADKTDGQVLLHRHLFEIPKGSRLEWKNENTLDLRRENLQLVHKDGTIEQLKKDTLPTIAPGTSLKDLPTGIYVTAGENQPTVVKQFTTGDTSAEFYEKKTSDVRGVYFHKASQRWHAAAFFEKKRYSLGYFKTEQEAIDEVTIFRLEGPHSPALKRNFNKKVKGTN